MVAISNDVVMNNSEYFVKNFLYLFASLPNVFLNFAYVYSKQISNDWLHNTLVYQFYVENLSGNLHHLSQQGLAH